MSSSAPPQSQLQKIVAMSSEQERSGRRPSAPVEAALVDLSRAIASSDGDGDGVPQSVTSRVRFACTVAHAENERVETLVVGLHEAMKKQTRDAPASPAERERLQAVIRSLI